MKPVFKTKNLAVHCFPDPQRKNRPVDIYYGLRPSFRTIVVHASLQQQPEGDWFIETIGLTGGCEEGGDMDLAFPLDLLVEFCCGLEKHVKGGQLLLFPRDEQGETLLMKWRPLEYQIYREWQVLEQLLLNEKLIGLRERYSHSDVAKN